MAGCPSTTRRQSGNSRREENRAGILAPGAELAAMPAETRARRRRMTESELIAVIEDAAKGGSWNAAAWLVERRWPERWSKSKGPIAPEATPVETESPDPFAGVVDLEAKRRSR